MHNFAAAAVFHLDISWGEFPPPPEMNPSPAGDAGEIYSTLINRLNLYILLDSGFQGAIRPSPSSRELSLRWHRKHEKSMGKNFSLASFAVIYYTHR